MSAIAAVSLTRDILLGEWHNTNAKGLFSRLLIRDNHDAAEVHAYGRLANGEADWGAVPASVYSFKFETSTGEAFSALYEFEDARVRLQANVKLGVLVVAIFVEFRDQRVDHFDREFFHRVRS
ncbi:MAG TPA: hypothetical protein VN181_15625 [Thermoanaerobaculia bacterium]|nr:hypothetical protein [Thermoanaerobaculia bacterium]